MFINEDSSQVTHCCGTMDYRTTLYSEGILHPNIIDTDLNSKRYPHDMTCLTVLGRADY